MDRVTATDIGDVLLERGLLGAAGLDRARRAAAEGQTRLAVTLATLGLVPEPVLAGALAEICGVRLLVRGDLPEHPPGDLSLRWLRLVRAVPVRMDEGTALVALADPEDWATIHALELALNRQVERAVATASDIEHALTGGEQEHAAPAAVAEDDLARIRDRASETPVVRWVDGLIRMAGEQRASDIHIEPAQGGVQVRLRIDGDLAFIDPPPPSIASAVIPRLKILARLDVAERRLPQDGRIRTTIRGREVDLRVSTVPTLDGESAVLRILDRGAVALDFAALGFSGPVLRNWRDAIHRPNGIVLVTGPTGHGKTTTLYASLAEIARPERKVFTVEDPVEYRLPGISQVQVNGRIGLDFARVLRSLLRQNPDIIMVGEIRDRETARVAVEASLTGHLVLASLHTNDAAGAVARLLDMNVEDFLLASTLAAVLAQRLVRTPCAACSRERPGADALLRRLDPGLRLDRPRLVEATGCPACRGTGWCGRTTISEILVANEDIRRLITRRAETAQIRRAAETAGLEPLRRAGLRKAFSGITTPEEVLRATAEV